MSEATAQENVVKDVMFTVTASARYLPMIAPFVGDRDDSYARGVSGIHFSPAPAGGIYIVATDGHSLAVIHDKDGQASEAVTVSVPWRIVNACREPRRPRLYDENGCEVGPEDLPGWMAPGWFVAHTAGCMVLPKDEKQKGVFASTIRTAGNIIRREDYRLITPRPDGNGGTTTYPDWHKVVMGFKPAAPVAHYWRHFNSRYLKRFAKVLSAPLTLTPSEGDDAPVMIRSEGHPEFCGFLMPMKGHSEFAVLPAWLTEANRAP